MEKCTEVRAPVGLPQSENGAEYYERTYRACPSTSGRHPKSISGKITSLCYGSPSRDARATGK